MAFYHQLKFPSTFIEYRSVSEWKGVVVISNFDSFRSRPFKSTAIGSCLVCLGLNTPLASLPFYLRKEKDPVPESLRVFSFQYTAKGGGDRNPEII